MYVSCATGGTGGGGEAGDGGDDGGNGGNGACTAQIVKPAMVAEPSVYQYIVWPSLMLKPVGPVAP